MASLLGRLPSMSFSPHRAVKIPEQPNRDEEMSNGRLPFQTHIPVPPTTAIAQSQDTSQNQASSSGSSSAASSKRPASPVQHEHAKRSRSSTSTYEGDSNVHIKLSTMTNLLLSFQDRFYDFDTRLDVIAENQEGLVEAAAERINESNSSSSSRNNNNDDLRRILTGIEGLGDSVESVRTEVNEVKGQVAQQRVQMMDVARKVEKIAEKQVQADKRIQLLITDSQAQKANQVSQSDLVNQLVMVTKSQTDLQRKYEQLVNVVEGYHQKNDVEKRGIDIQGMMPLLTKLDTIEKIFTTLATEKYDTTSPTRLEQPPSVRIPSNIDVNMGDYLDVDYNDEETIDGDNRSASRNSRHRHAQAIVAEQDNEDTTIRVDHRLLADDNASEDNEPFYDFAGDFGVLGVGYVNEETTVPPLSAGKRKDGDDTSDTSNARLDTPATDAGSSQQPPSIDRMRMRESNSEILHSDNETEQPSASLVQLVKRRAQRNRRSTTSQMDDFGAGRNGRRAFPPRPTPKALQRQARSQSQTPLKKKPRSKAVLRKRWGPVPKISERSLPASDGHFRGQGHWPKKADYTIKSRMQEIVCEICKGRVHWFCAGLEDDDPSPDGEWFCPDCDVLVRNDTPRNTIDIVQQYRCIRGDCLLRAKKRLVRKPHDEERYYPERIIGQRRVDGSGTKKTEWLLKWIGWETDWSTWEPRENIDNLPEMLGPFKEDCNAQGILDNQRLVLLTEARKYFDGDTGDLKDEYAEHDSDDQGDGEDDEVEEGAEANRRGWSQRRESNEEEDELENEDRG